MLCGVLEFYRKAWDFTPRWHTATETAVTLGKSRQSHWSMWKMIFLPTPKKSFCCSSTWNSLPKWKKTTKKHHIVLLLPLSSFSALLLVPIFYTINVVNWCLRKKSNSLWLSSKKAPHMYTVRMSEKGWAPHGLFQSRPLHVPLTGQALIKIHFEIRMTWTKRSAVCAS